MAKRKSRARQKPSAPIFGGDHGTNTMAANANSVVEEIKNADGSNPNQMARRRRKSAIDAISLSMRQEQAANEIQNAWCKVQMLESGSPLKAKVDASPKLDATIAAQVDAQSRWIKASRAILSADRRLVFHVCCDNRPITEAGRRMGIPRAVARFKKAMDRVADALDY